MDIATLQRRLLGLIKHNELMTEDDDPYLCMVEQSEHLKVMRKIVFLWRAYELERYCTFTATLLKRKCIFDETVCTFIQNMSISPFIERLGITFLEEMSHHDDTIIASLAQFEAALLKVKQGDPATYIIEWQCDPYSLLERLLNDRPLDEARNPFRTIVSSETPGLFRVIPVTVNVPSSK